MFTCIISGTTQPQKSGTDDLLDLLSTGAPPAQNGSSTADILSIGQDNNKTSVNALDSLSLPVVTSAQSSSASSIIDLLDGFGPAPTAPSKFYDVLGCSNGGWNRIKCYEKNDCLTERNEMNQSSCSLIFIPWVGLFMEWNENLQSNTFCFIFVTLNHIKISKLQLFIFIICCKGIIIIFYINFIF